MTAGKLLLTRFSKSICRLFVPVHLVIQADLSHFPVPPSSGPTFHNRARMAGFGFPFFRFSSELIFQSKNYRLESMIEYLFLTYLRE
uniref:Uncharacterized protein n=1 Tax=Picea glauca TaxID=3330 RepID=A0A101LZY0_PICGL|nr:hypothetical protein ABT39_MTgene4479 [Picea glauca]